MAYLDVTIDIPEGELNLNHIDRIIEMAWEDRTPFEAIKLQFGLNEAEVKTLMKSQLKFRSYTLWRERVECCKTKHLKRRLNKVSRFKSKQQRNISSNKISKKDNG
ncbi:MAG: TIGR03643 family protein [Bacteroidota bacterium]|nr:TIGR03643 family protein [Bacteroidota bacterium]MDP3147055.1 TIGR03643 family protein [Bacteroidota bacterium]